MDPPEINIARATVLIISAEQSRPVLIAAIGKLFREHIDLLAHHLRADRFDARDFPGISATTQVTALNP